MSSKALLEKRETKDWQPPPERAPSEMIADQPLFARVIGAIGLSLFLLGSVILFSQAMGRSNIITATFGTGWATAFLVFGMSGLLFHAAGDADIQWRRTYLAFGFLWLAIGVLLAVLPYEGRAGGLFLPYGLTALGVSLLFLSAAARHETDTFWREAVAWGLGGFGTTLALSGFLFGHLSLEFLLPRGLLLILIGLAFLWAFVGLKGSDDKLGYAAGLGLGIVGVLSLSVAGVRSWIDPQTYLMPSGLLLGGVGLVYLAVSAGICSDRSLVILTRRELARFLYAPIFYPVMIGVACVAWYAFLEFVTERLWNPSVRFGQEMPTIDEPMIRYYIINWYPIVCVMFLPSILTMALLSEERRSGTLEVLLTAPLNETVVVLSKFLAAFIFFMVIWLPWGLFFVALRVEGGKPFDYLPMLSFYLAMAFMAAEFVSMGLFFSSLVQNQVAAAILSFVGMNVLLSLPALSNWVTSESLSAVLNYVSFAETWTSAVAGKLALRKLIYHLSATGFWLFLSVKVLESRKWW